MAETLYVRHGRLHYFVREALKRLRVPATHASKIGDALIAADLAGVDGEGVSRLPLFATRIRTGLINPNPSMKIAHQEEATATIDGDNGMGHVVGMRSMELAMELAKQFGVSAVAARNSNDFGMAGYYARMALEEQMIGIAMSNATPAMIPTYGKTPMLGANPLAIAIPAAEDAAPFVLDFATTAMSRPSIEDAARRGEKLPDGIALDASGEMTNDPKTALEVMSLLPLGGVPSLGSHKGFGLALAIDILSGIVSGGSFGRELGGAKGTHQQAAGIGHFFIAVRLRAFGPWVKFRNSISDMMRQLTSAPAKGAPRIYYPGEAEVEIDQERRASGIPIAPDVAAELEGLSRQLDIHDSWEHLIEGKK
jgi:LDH2 family malate/lactate/ureidoglycolate dehydrogenase